jgi:hypothetical protein
MELVELTRFATSVLRLAKAGYVRWVGVQRNQATQHRHLLGLEVGTWPLPRSGRNRDASTPRYLRRKAERCRRLRPGACTNGRRKPIRSSSLAICHPFSAYWGRRQRKLFRNALDNCERLMRTPSLALISPRRRAIAQIGRSTTGSSSNGVTTRSEFWLSQPNRVLRHAERLGDPRTGPIRKGQQKRSRAVRLLRGRAIPPGPSARPAVPHSPQQEICRPCRTRQISADSEPQYPA